MRRKLVLLIALMAVCTGMFGAVFIIQPVKAAGPYYIRADGSIFPYTPLISTTNNVTYTLTGNIVIDTHNDGIIVERGNITIDGAGYKLQGPGASYLDTEGIRAQEVSNLTISNLTITAFRTGIWLWLSPNGTISGNNITNTEHGIDVESYSNHTSIYGNNVTNNGGAGIILSESSNCSIYSNTIDGNDVAGISIGSFCNDIDVYDNRITDNHNGVGLGSSRNRVYGNNITDNNNYGVICSGWNYSIYANNITGNAEYGIYLLSASSNNSIFDNEISANGFSGINLYDSSNDNEIYGNRIGNNTQHGVLLHGSADYNKIFGNNVTGNEESGLFVSDCTGNEIYENEIADNSEGVNIEGSLNTSVHGNRIAHNWLGIRLGGSANYTDILENEITWNTGGIYFYDSSTYNTIAGNNITNSSSYGVRLSASSNNTFYHNSFVDNANQVYVDPDHPNTWDDNYPSGGNYWSEYVDVDQYSGSNQDEPDSDGIWDHPYVIDDDNQDNYPMVPEFPSLIVLPLFMAMTLLAAALFKTRSSF